MKIACNSTTKITTINIVSPFRLFLVTSIFRETNLEQKIIDLSHTNDISRKSSFRESIENQDHRISIAIPVLLSISFNHSSFNAHFVQGAMLEDEALWWLQ